MGERVREEWGVSDEGFGMVKVCWEGRRVGRVSGVKVRVGEKKGGGK